MTVHQLERRARPLLSGDRERTTADIVRLGLAAQRTTGTVSAVELLKANKIDGAIIQRVLSGTALRTEDKEYLLTVS